MKKAKRMLRILLKGFGKREHVDDGEVQRSRQSKRLWEKRNLWEVNEQGELTSHKFSWLWEKRNLDLLHVLIHSFVVFQWLIFPILIIRNKPA